METPGGKQIPKTEENSTPGNLDLENSTTGNPTTRPSWLPFFP